MTIEILKATDSPEQRVIKIIRFNARVIELTEGRSRAEAEYWAIRTLFDSLCTRSGDEESARVLMKVVEELYPHHLHSIGRYAAWKTSNRKSVEPVVAHARAKA